MAGFPRFGRWLRRALVATAAAVAAAVALAAPLAAQARGARDSLDALRDSLAGVTDSAGLRGLEARLIGVVKQPALYSPRSAADSARAALLHLSIGFVELRLGDVAGHEHYDGAASEFQWASELEPKWPFPAFGLGLAELGVGDFSNPVLHGLQTMLGRDALTRSAIDFARSAEADPSFIEGLVELSSIALRQRVNVRLDVALAALRRAARTPAGSNPDVLLARCRVERAVGSPDSALAAVTALLAREPDNAAGLLELARTRFFLGDVGGNAPWYRGLGLASGSALAEYRGDLVPVLPDSTLHAFDAASPSERVAMMRDFWTTRDRTSLHHDGERLMEHYRRLDFAERNYRLVATNRHYDIVERYRPARTEFDDRGAVYIRQGRPDDVRRLDVPALAPNVTWSYHRAGGDLLFTFVARHGVDDYRLVESLFDVLGNDNAIELGGTGDVQGNDLGPTGSQFLGNRPLTPQAADSLARAAHNAELSGAAAALLRSRVGLDPIYQRLLSSGRGAAPGLEAAERALGRRSIRIGTRTDSWPLRYPRVLPATLASAAVGVDSAGPEVELAWAIPTSTLPASHDSLAVRAALLGLDGSLVASLDTTMAIGAAATTGTELLGHLPIVVPPGKFTVRVALAVDSTGEVWPVDTLEVASPLGPAVGISDLALGAARVPLQWTTPRGDTVWFNPHYRFAQNDPLDLYFEVMGLTPDSSYRTELDIRRQEGGWGVWRAIRHLFGGGSSHIAISTDATAHQTVEPVHRVLSLEKLKPGDYVMQVTVTTPGHRKVVRRQEFRIDP